MTFDETAFNTSGGGLNSRLEFSLVAAVGVPRQRWWWQQPVAAKGRRPIVA
jgi:hypothetical protein